MNEDDLDLEGYEPAHGALAALVIIALFSLTLGVLGWLV